MTVRQTLILGFLLLVALPAAGQQPAAAPEPPAATAPLAANWQDGFVVQSANGDYRIQFGAVAQTDGRFSVDDPLPITNTFTVRKARPIVSGRLARYFDFRLMPDFGSGTPVILDAYVDTRFSPAFRLRVGKDKTPVGYELLIGDANLFFPERTLASGLVPNRDIGFQAQGDLAGQRVSYSAGVFNGVPDGVTSSTDVDTNGSKDVAGRVVVQPFRSATPTAAGGLGFHFGASAGQQLGPVPSYRTSIGQTYFSYATGVTANGARRRLAPAVFYYLDSFGAFAEYIGSSQHVSRAGLTNEISNQGWQVTAAYLLTGESASAGTIRPRRSFDPPNGQWGAVQLLARYSRLEVDDEVFANGLAAAGASQRAAAVTLGVNWYPTSFIKWYATYERTMFDGAGAPRPDENAVLFRAQLAF
jgi:phosphate-selective porin OprO/OprP